MTDRNAAADAREAVAARREELDEVLSRYGASNPRLFGSVASAMLPPIATSTSWWISTPREAIR